MADIFDQIFQLATEPPWNVVIIGGAVAAVVIYIIYIMYGKKAEPEEFQIEDFRESVYLSVEKLINTFGISIKANMTRGIEPIGDIQSFYHFKGKLIINLDAKDLKKDDKKGEDVDLWIFKLGKGGILNAVFGGANVDYVIVENDHMGTFNSSNRLWPVKEGISFIPYGNVFVSSKKGEAFVNDISFRRSQEEILTMTQNFPRKVSYLEVKQAKTMERLEATLKKKQAGYDGYKKSVLAAGKDIDEEDDDE